MSRRVPAGRVLLVEDDDILALLMAHELQPLGLELQRVVSGQDAFEAACFTAPRPNLVVMDVLLPGLSGIEATIMLRDYERRRRMPALPIIGCSGLGRVQIHQSMLRAGMNMVLQKPLPFGRLATLVRQLLAADAPARTDGLAANTPAPTVSAHQISMTAP